MYVYIYIFQNLDEAVFNSQSSNTLGKICIQLFYLLL